MRPLTGLLGRLVVTVAVLAVLAVLVDLGARIVTERRVAAQIQSEQHLAEAPDVGIGGLSFLRQAARGSFDEVTVRTGTVQVPGGLPLSSVDARLTGVTLPMADLVGGQVTRLPVQTIRATASVSLSTLSTTVARNLPAEITDVQLARTSAGALTVSARFAGFGVSLPFSAVSTVRLSGDTLVVAVPAASLTAIPAPLRDVLAGLLTARVALPELPQGLAFTGVSVEADRLAFTAQGRRVVLQG